MILERLLRVTNRLCHTKIAAHGKQHGQAPHAVHFAEIHVAAARLPEAFRSHLDEVVVVVEDVPGIENLTGDGPALDPAELLGLFHGATLADRSFIGPGGDLPPRILLFQRNLERYAADPDDLREQIAITLYHELGHYLGMDEDDLDRIDLA